MFSLFVVPVTYTQPHAGSEPKSSRAQGPWGYFLHKNKPERKCPKNSVPSELGNKRDNSTFPSNPASQGLSSTCGFRLWSGNHGQAPPKFPVPWLRLHRLTGWLGRLNMVDRSVAPFQKPSEQRDTVVPAEDPGQDELVWRCSCTEGWGRCLQCSSVCREVGGNVHSSALNEGKRSHLFFAPGS